MGFDNMVAEILASELGAEVSYFWTLLDAESVRTTLLRGECDVVVGVAEGVEGVINTVPYYNAPYVFLYRADSDFEVTSLDDAILSELRIATYQGGVPFLALGNRNLSSNIVVVPPVGGPGGIDRDTPIVNALIAGEIDVAILYGPSAGIAQQRASVDLRMNPVTPEIDPPMFFMFRTWTIGVRLGDDVLRDRLNVALEARWTEIQEMLASYGVPLGQISRPSVRAEDKASVGRSRVGVIVPNATGAVLPMDTLGESARRGALIADSEISSKGNSEAFQILLASAPSVESSVRAARRLVETEGIMALVGGFSYEEVAALSEVAQEADVLFFNVGAIEDDLRGRECSLNTFHVQASTTMYLDALGAWYERLGPRSWFFVREDSEMGLEVYRRAQSALGVIEEGVSGGSSSAAVPRDQHVYYEVLDAIQGADTDTVLVLLDAVGQDMFLAQYERSGLSHAVAFLPTPLSQSREFYYRFQQVAPKASSNVRVSLWDATIESGGGGALNQTFAARTGEPMEGAAWATYAALMIVYGAVSETGLQDASTIRDYIVGNDSLPDLGKGAGMSFREWDRQLRQPLYFVAIDPEAEWGHRATARIEFVDYQGQMPGAPEDGKWQTMDLDALGASASESPCVP